MEAARPMDEPTPEPETPEPRRQDSGPHDLSARDWIRIVVRAGKSALADQITDAAAAVAYYAFLAVPAVLLLAYGLFSLVAGPDAITTLMDKLREIAPQEAVDLLEDSLRRATQNRSSGLVMLVVGSVLALWTASGAMQALMRALNRAYRRKESRGFVRLRLTAVAMIALALLSFVLVFGLLVLGPQLSRWVDSALGWEGGFTALWWVVEWPILILGLLAAFAAVLYLGPDAGGRRWQWVSGGAVVALVIWLAASGLFAAFVSRFGSYNKAWGALAAVVIMLTWLWLSALALLLGAEVNAEAERSRRPQGEHTSRSAVRATAKV